MTLLVTGTIGIDTVETPEGRADRVLGGSCAYFAAAASLHTPVRVVGAVGVHGGSSVVARGQKLERPAARLVQLRRMAGCGRPGADTPGRGERVPGAAPTVP